MTVTVTISGVDLNVRTQVNDGLPSRRVLTPGHLEAGAWVATDLSTEPDVVKAAAVEAWTKPAVDAYKAELLAAYVPPVTDFTALDLATLNDALAAPGSVVRALALLTFQEINALRVRAGLTAYTMTQFTTALKAKMRNGA